LNCDVSDGSKELENADAIIVATGSVELEPSINGINGPNVIKVVDAHRNPALIKGDRVLVAGGGLSGCDFAIECAQAGKQVTIVEMLPAIARDMISVNAIALKKMLAKYKVDVLVSHKITAFTGSGVQVESEDGGRELTADTVVIAFGCKPNNKTALAIRNKYPLHTRIIGDSSKVGKVGDAIREGFFAANAID
jgi:pyruvate/2-oxoglutarate dehydrogenase complex dihydrolipoamide dehydrogenase (E3) component